ncbi:hypothetical protein TrVE_jg11654 [Triparma verrucosa]|uniref:Uncharacterized protein n=1 Tax=Triparma verrucosa TaxID=1606542 RepID=A0A9W7DM75_9STRA|nr:hypothetical protein TrVE_jg11654 [Triparma verrucosa]
MGPGGSQLAFKTLFKDFSRAIRKLPKKFEREEAVDDLRAAFAKPLPATFAEQNELYQTGLKRLAFLHMQTGGAPRPTSGSRTIYSKGTKVEVKPADKVDPSLVGGSDKAPYSNWHGGNLDPESVQKHQRLLKRAGFKNNADAIGNGGVF